jgi:hypothetical protein
MVVGAMLTASAVGQTVLIDFGNDNSFRGVSVPAPDQNGNYWNSLLPGLFYTASTSRTRRQRSTLVSARRLEPTVLTAQPV